MSNKKELKQIKEINKVLNDRVTKLEDLYSRLDSEIHPQTMGGRKG